MRKQFLIGISVCCLAMTITAYSHPRINETAEDSILSKKIELHLRKATLLNALSALAVIHRVPIGIEYAAADKNESKLDLQTGGSSLKEILDSLIQQEPLYRWELTDGVINFIPVGERDPFFETLLNTPISLYDPGKWTIKFQLRDAIENTPEVQRLLKSRNVELGKYRDYAYFPSIYTEKDVILKMTNTTVRDILNRIIKASEHKHWAIGWRAGEKNVFSIWL